MTTAAEAPRTEQWRIDIAVEYLGDQLRLGRGKKKKVRALLLPALDNPCPYCNVKITVDNASVDHKEPYGDSRFRRESTAEQKAYYDRIENLQITCRSCNSMKEDFSDLQWRQLLQFMVDHPGLAPLLRKRLARSKMVWKK
jgi:HNH endonuclease.